MKGVVPVNRKNSAERLDGPEELKNAVVLQTVKDWRDAMKRLKRKPDNKDAEKIRKECEWFFRSRWFCFWTEVNGESLLRRLKGEYVHDC